jgi:hypothetical protein
VDSDRLNRWLTLLANTGVLIGIIFLAVELRQNNENLAAQQRAIHFTTISDGWTKVAENPQLSALIAKDFAGEELSTPELIQLQALWTRIHHQIQWAYNELPDDQFQRGLRFNRDDYAGLSSYRRAWKTRRDFYDPEFVQYMEANVFIDE